jgi:hypothetical protein
MSIGRLLYTNRERERERERDRERETEQTCSARAEHALDQWPVL